MEADLGLDGGSTNGICLVLVSITSVSALIIYDFALSDKLSSRLVVLIIDNKDDVEDELEVHLLDADVVAEEVQLQHEDTRAQ